MKRIFMQFAAAVALPLMLFLAAGCDNFFNDIADEPYKIAFRSSRTGSIEIFTMNADGSEQTQITFSGTTNGQPRWSPDGEKIAFIRNNDIYIMDADGANPVQLTSGGTYSNPSWSPDGTQLVIESSTTLYILDIATKTVGPSILGSAQQPYWSPRSGKIVCSHQFSISYQVGTFNPDGSGAFKLTPEVSSSITPFWSPDGSQIVYANAQTGVNNFYVTNADGSSEPIPLTYFTNGNQNYPSISADSEHIVFQRNDTLTWQIYLMDADGSNLQQLTSLGNNTEPCFSPR